MPVWNNRREKEGAGSSRTIDELVTPGSGPACCVKFFGVDHEPAMYLRKEIENQYPHKWQKRRIFHGTAIKKIALVLYIYNRCCRKRRFDCHT